MRTQTFELKKEQPLVRENQFGKKYGYYLETVSDKNNIWIRFTGSRKQKHGPVYIGEVETIRAATKKEIKEFF